MLSRWTIFFFFFFKKINVLQKRHTSVSVINKKSFLRIFFIVTIERMTIHRYENITILQTIIDRVVDVRSFVCFHRRSWINGIVLDAIEKSEFKIHTFLYYACKSAHKNKKKCMTPQFKSRRRRALAYMQRLTLQPAESRARTYVCASIYVQTLQVYSFYLSR